MSNREKATIALLIYLAMTGAFFSGVIDGLQDGQHQSFQFAGIALLIAQVAAIYLILLVQRTDE